jgi:hypothetical protein
VEIRATGEILSDDWMNSGPFSLADHLSMETESSYRLLRRWVAFTTSTEDELVSPLGYEPVTGPDDQARLAQEQLSAASKFIGCKDCGGSGRVE